MKICFATHNPNKLKEVQQLAPRGITIVGLESLDFYDEIPETGDSFEQNALLKVNAVFQRHGIPCFADDSGLEVNALNGAPGIYSARYAGEHGNAEKNMDKLLNALDGEKNRTAQFKTVVAYMDEYPEVTYFEGVCEGKILTKRTGNKGFGYDPIFQPKGHDRSFAQMSDRAKNAISHRGIAIQAFFKHLNYQLKM